MRLEYPMKENGMYILSKKNFDEIATNVLLEYMPDTLNYPKATDIEYLAEECLYLDIKHDYIVPNGKVLGMIAFSDTQFKTYDFEAEEKVIEMQEGTMLIDMSLIGTENRARKRFTEAHEASHWICHRSYHSPSNRQYDFRINNYVACRTENIEAYGVKNKIVKSDNDWEEWQADSLAAALLMPKDTFILAAKEAMNERGIWRGYLSMQYDVQIINKVISELAHVFDVSFKAAKIRMLHLGLIG